MRNIILGSYNGHGAIQDLQEAYIWLSLATANVDKKGKEIRDLALKTCLKSD